MTQRLNAGLIDRQMAMGPAPAGQRGGCVIGPIHWATAGRGHRVYDQLPRSASYREMMQA